MADDWKTIGSSLTTLMFAYTIFQQFFPRTITDYIYKLVRSMNPYIQITFHEYTGEHLNRSEAFTAIQLYLSKDCGARARKLTANAVKGTKSLVLSMDDDEEIADEFEGVRVWWKLVKEETRDDRVIHERRYYVLQFPGNVRNLITEKYLDHVMETGKMMAIKNRLRKIYSNNPSKSWWGWQEAKWSHAPFEHPATFDTLAMEKKKKDEIKRDLVKFSQSRDYYKQAGKAWKRGYLLFGPPGTGKSTMIAAMANFLGYDVYDLELTTVNDNNELRRLLIETTAKSIIVIEDIDCTLELTGKRNQGEEEEDGENSVKKKHSNVTLSGILNFVDGLWSACGDERIIVFTTNYIDKLDPALIRKGRMDKHIEMSYCCFEAFEVLAKNYLKIEWNELYGEIKALIEKTKMSPADVVENLLPTSEDEQPEACLKRLIKALEESKMKEEEAEKKKAEEEENEKKKKKKKKKTEKKKQKERKIEENNGTDQNTSA